MTTSIMKTTVSEDLIITTPEQLTLALQTMGVGAGDPNAAEYGAEIAKVLISILAALNEEA